MQVNSNVEVRITRPLVLSTKSPEFVAFTAQGEAHMVLTKRVKVTHRAQGGWSIKVPGKPVFHATGVDYVMFSDGSDLVGGYLPDVYTKNYK